MGSDHVTEAARELYAADPADFTRRRKALADTARADGDKEAAKEIIALRKPTRAAWIINRLARADPGAPGRIETLAAGLRAAAQAKDGRRLRELSADRGELIDALTSQALAAAGVTDVSAGLREDIAGTLTSALADPDIARRFATGTLTRAAQWAGFGLLPATDTTDTGTGPIDQPDRAQGSARGPQPTARRPAPPPATPDPRPAPPPASRQAQSPRPASAREPQPERQPQAPEDAATRRRKAFDNAERSLVAAAEAAAAAVAAEDRLEAAVRDLEQRLTKARAELAAARLRARRAESAERRARQISDRLSHP